ncbi:hypothetical protein GCM10009551_053720 [Nocardiopsis tropica]|uniref:hypothetical protein n=1 Tax=Tsukamurella strandjordii TaxID=147577 RepID=UPI0031CFEB09
MLARALDRIRRAEEDAEELDAVLEALSAEKASTHQIADALGIADGELGAFLSSRAVVVDTPAALRAGDIIVATEHAASTLIKVQRPYRRLIGEPAYSAEIIMPGSRHCQRVDGAVLAPWFPVKVLRPTTALQ